MRNRWIAAGAGVALSAVVMLGMAERSEATNVTWSTDTSGNGCTTDCRRCQLSSGYGHGRQRPTFTAAGGQGPQATAFSAINSTTALRQGLAWACTPHQLLRFRVTDSGEMASPGSPNHTVSNAVQKDMIVFQFADPTYVPLSLIVNMFSTCGSNNCYDSDVTAWVGNGPTSGAILTDLADTDWTTLTYTSLTQPRQRLHSSTTFRSETIHRWEVNCTSCVTSSGRSNLNSGGLNLCGASI